MDNLCIVTKLHRVEIIFLKEEIIHLKQLLLLLLCLQMHTHMLTCGKGLDSSALKLSQQSCKS